VKSLKARRCVSNRNAKNLPASRSGSSNVNSNEQRAGEQASRAATSTNHAQQTNPTSTKLAYIIQMGVKRPHAAMAEQESNASASAPNSSPIMSMFEGFRAELDEHHDRRERIIKASRDITASSKKM
jgi:hypothetical protein